MKPWEVVWRTPSGRRCNLVFSGDSEAEMLPVGGPDKGLVRIAYLPPDAAELGEFDWISFSYLELDD